MTTKISYSSELMSNYMQGETVSPGSKFQALQSADGHSLLFSISTEGVFYLTEEMPSTVTGWQQSDLSSVLAIDFSAGSTIVAKTFAAGQTSAGGKFSVALSVTVAGNDYLYTASSYTRDGSGLINLNWVASPFDAKGKSYNTIDISDIYVLQTPAVALIVVSIVPPGMTTIERYYINPTGHAAKYNWFLYTLPLNMAAASASVCGGRKAGEGVDGIYSLGNVGSAPVVVYQEIVNPFNPKAPGATSQLIAGNSTPAAMASAPSAATTGAGVIYTDLYVSTTEGDLYFFAATNQSNNAQGLMIMTNDLFKQISSLYAYSENNKVVVWGLNRAQQIFYTQCDTANVTDPTAWSYPVPIASGVEQISPYINIVNGGNTFFAHVGTNTLKKVFQDPVSTTWTTQNILLPVDPQTPSTKFDCYMTRLTVTDEDNTPLVGVNVNVASAYRVPVYVNNHYYVLDTARIPLLTDSQGAIKIVQAVINLQGACLSVQSADGTASLAINPMDNAATKTATLNTADALSSAEVINDDGSTGGPLVPPGTTSDSLNSAAASVQSLSDAYNNYNPVNNTNAAMTAMRMTYPANFAFSPQTRVHTISVRGNTLQMNAADSVGDTLSDIGNAIVVAAGDLCSWLVDATDYVIQIIEDTAQKVWNFVATVAGAVYTFVIDTVEKVIDALQAIFNALMTIIKDLVQFLKFLFSWTDIKRTNDVMVNIIHLYLDYGVGELDKLKGWINSELATLVGDINSWAGLPSGSNAGFISQPMNEAQAQTNYAGVYTSPNTYLQDQFTNNIANASYIGDGNTGSALKDTLELLLKTLLDSIKDEWTVLKATADALDNQLFKNDQWKTMSLGDILTTITAIIADGLLASVGVVIDAFIDLVVAFLDGLIELLTQPIWIPVVSDILNDVFDYQFQFSLLEVLCLVGSIPATILYKLRFDVPPFTTDDGYSTQIIDATDLQSLMITFGAAGEIDYSQQFYSSFWLPESAKNTIYITTHTISGIAAIVQGVLIEVEDLLELPFIPFVTTAKQIAAIIQSGGYSAAGIFAKPYPIQNNAVSMLSSGLTYLSMACSVIFGVSPKLTKSETAKSAIEELGAVVDILISLTAIAPVAYHFVELAETESNNFRTLAIIDETARICTYLSSICDDIAKFDPEPVTSTAIALTSSALALLNGGLQIAETIVDDE